MQRRRAGPRRHGVKVDMTAVRDPIFASLHGAVISGMEMRSAVRRAPMPVTPKANAVWRTKPPGLNRLGLCDEAAGFWREQFESPNDARIISHGAKRLATSKRHGFKFSFALCETVGWV